MLLQTAGRQAAGGDDAGAEPRHESLDRAVEGSADPPEIGRPVRSPELVPGHDERNAAKAAAESERNDVDVGNARRLDEIESRFASFARVRVPQLPSDVHGVPTLEQLAGLLAPEKAVSR